MTSEKLQWLVASMDAGFRVAAPRGPRLNTLRYLPFHECFVTRYDRERKTSPGVPGPEDEGGLVPPSDELDEGEPGPPEFMLESLFAASLLIFYKLMTAETPPTSEGWIENE